MIFMLVVAALMLLVVAPLLGIMAFVRTKAIAELQDSIENLKTEVTGLRRQLGRLETAPIEKPPSAPAAPKPEPRVVAAPPTVALEPPPLVVAPPPQPPPVVAAPPTVAPPPVVAVPHHETEPGPAPPPDRPAIDWERWIGIRGAAVLGGVALALAGLLFFQYSIQHGLIGPTMRVVLGLGVGLFSIVASEWLRPRGYHAAAEGLAGAGVVVLYGALWAGHALYHLIPMLLCFGLMILVTAVCGLLAIRHTSRLVAVLGLVGGFATPLLLNSQSDRPIGLFGYILLLDLGLLAVGRRRGWPWLSLLGLGGTLLLQGLWIGMRMGPDRLWLGLVILAVFAALFTVNAFLAGQDRQGFSRLSQAGGLLLPFAFALYFASRVDLGPHLWPVAVLLAVLSIGASWVGRRQATPMLGTCAAIGCVSVFAIWHGRPDHASVWESVAIAGALALIFHVFVELDRKPHGFDGPAPAAMLSACGFFLILIFASARPGTDAFWPWLTGWSALVILLYRHAVFPERAVLQLVGALGAAAGLATLHFVHAHDEKFPLPGAFLGVAVMVGAAFQAAAMLRRDALVRRFADHAAAAFALTLALSLSSGAILEDAGPALGLGVPLLLGVLALLVAARRGAGGWALGALLVLTILQIVWVWGRPGIAENAREAGAGLTFVLVTAAIFLVWPFVGGRALQADRWGWYSGALAGPAAFFAAKRLWPISVGPGSIGLLPIVLGAMALAGVAGARRGMETGDAARKSAIVWFAAVAISFASLAIPLQLDKSWVTIGWALEGAALLALWRRLDHPGLKWYALALLGAVTLRLFPTAALLGWYPRSATRILNWVLYTYLVPAAALFASAWLLLPFEAARARPWEQTLYAKRRPVGAIGSTLAGIAVVFTWINLAIADWYAEGPRLTLQFGRSAARDLTVSIAWALYALILLGFGMARSNIGLRWLSLSFLVVTIGKVFLYDLSELRDLYRVVSLVGLAFSLLLVSLLYQRFVFRRPVREKA